MPIALRASGASHGNERPPKRNDAASKDITPETQAAT
jgi:hypothetical protein